ncbi:MAG TPA: response regulator transcription factor [Acidimicrobiales bacterium]|jgi:DNA-binding NarL/FixJ family response regulator|nr:response regulator transcription factor [Acidimicrobiales bacterium]
MTPDPPSLRIVVADDQRAVREALATVLDAENGFEVVGLAADGNEAVELAHRVSPDVVLMDLRMPNTDGVAATRRLSIELPHIRVVVLTTFADDVSIVGALEAGATGFLTKDAGREQIALAVRSAAAGQSVLDPAVQASLLRAAQSSTPASQSPMSELLPDNLTPREADVLRAIAAGQSNAEIAAELYISEVTVKSHINHLFAKISARNRAEAVRYAYDHGLVAGPP